MLLHRLAELANRAGITHLIAEVLTENSAMLSVFHGAGFPIESTCAWGTVELTMTIAPPSASTPRCGQIGTTQSTLVPPPSAG
jgi:hypothetical protein